jgi:hypothetical protein
MVVPINFARRFGERPARSIATEKLVNWYVQFTESHGKDTAIIKQRSGLIVRATIGIGPHRGALEFDGVMYLVSGSGFYTYNTAGTATFIFDLATYRGDISMASNGLQLLIVDGQDGWLYTYATGAHVQIADADFVDAKQVVFYRGRFIVIKPGTGQFYISALYDGTSWQSLDYASAEIDPDNLLALIVSHQECGYWAVHHGSYTDTGRSRCSARCAVRRIRGGIAALPRRWRRQHRDPPAKTRDGHGSVAKATVTPKVIPTTR